jgi:outer membrane protein OmpU
MKNVLFATTAASALLIGGIASAQGIALFGDARLGLGYNINNEGGVLTETTTNDDGTVSVDTPDDLRAVSRVRFGVNMTGETDAGITFGATIRADNAIGGQGGTLGQTAGNVFVSGDWGTLTMGDTNGADEQWVGDVNEVGLTCLGCQNETLFVSNGGGFGSDTANNFASNPEARPTIRYDFDIMGFGLSLSSNRDLTDIGVGGGYAGQWGNASWNIGAGYYQFDEFSVFDPEIVQVQVVDDAGDPVIDANGDPVLVNVAGNDVETEIGAGEQWSVGAGGDFDAFSGKVVWTQISADDTDAEAQELLIGLGFGFDAWSVDGYYGQIISASGGGSLDTIDGLQSYGVGVTYDLGGGARVEGGVASVWDLGLADDGFMVADFGIGMAF